MFKKGDKVVFHGIHTKFDGVIRDYSDGVVWVKNATYIVNETSPDRTIYITNVGWMYEDCFKLYSPFDCKHSCPNCIKKCDLWEDATK
jgi:hypothetical protein